MLGSSCERWQRFTESRRHRRPRTPAGSRWRESVAGWCCARTITSADAPPTDAVILDEAHALTAEQAAALLPVLSSRPDPQLWYAAAGPAPGAWQLSRLRQRVLHGDTPRLAWLEWSADPQADTEDRSVWLAANPAAAAGRLSVERMAEERASLGFDGFRAERLACAPWPSEMDGAYGLFTPDDLRDLFGRTA
jgi:hypothetical protein